MNTSVRLVSLALVLFAGACAGASGDKTYEGGGVSFTYPGEWEEFQRASVNADATAFFVVGPEAGYDGLIFEASDQQRRVTEENFDEAFEDVAAALQESTEGPTRLEVDGRPALRFVAHPEEPEEGVELTREVTVIFDGTRMFVLNCGFTGEHADEMKKGCAQARESFSIE